MAQFAEDGTSGAVREGGRAAAREDWLARLGLADARREAIVGDASPRRYWRLPEPGLVLMDAPPPEDLLPFLRVALRFRAAGLRTPRVLHASLRFGFALLEDLGEGDLKEAIDGGADPGFWYRRAIDSLLDLHSAGRHYPARPFLPPYDRDRLATELQLFPDWYLGRYLGLRLSPAQRGRLGALFATLLDGAAAQPAVWVHRDYHARNLIPMADGNLGVVDFQDAVQGPMSYDLASLLWDRYWHWSAERRDGWMEYFLEGARARALPVPDRRRFAVQLRRMGLQRNLKILGIFCRLAYRDGKEGYLAFLPRFHAFVLEALAEDDELAEHGRYLADWAPAGKSCAP